MKIKSISKIIFAAAIVSFGSCKNHYVSSEKPVITVSIEPQRWLLERIVGDRMEVRTLMAQGGNPESYEPAFAHLADLESSVCYMKMGNLGFENAIVDRISSGLPELLIVNTSDSISLIHDDHGHDHGIDPHVWSSAKNGRIIAANMLKALKVVDPDGADIYDDNYMRLIQTIDSIDNACTEILDADSGSSFMVWHPSLSYFARDYGLKQISVGAEGKEHSVLNTRDVLKQVDKEDAVAFLVQQDFDASKAASIVKENDSIRVVTINPMNYDWSFELLHTARAIAGQ